MKNFLITQNLYKRSVLQFSLDKCWFDYAKKLNINIIPIGFNEFDKNYFKSLNFSGIIFSGGNDLYKFSKKKENHIRDKYETLLLKYAIDNNKKIIAVCRGFQFIGNYFENKIIKISNHVKKKHRINFVKNKYIKKKNIYTNSYHNFGFLNLNKEFQIIANSDDGNIEIAINKKHNILCFMFHPERFNNSQKDIDYIIKKFI
tara:strand:+ start:272 stop:877 length:606 start_codon:yes stop_codon:yes gene_type:complete